MLGAAAAANPAGNLLQRGGPKQESAHVARAVGSPLTALSRDYLPNILSAMQHTGAGGMGGLDGAALGAWMTNPALRYEALRGTGDKDGNMGLRGGDGSGATTDPTAGFVPNRE